MHKKAAFSKFVPEIRHMINLSDLADAFKTIGEGKVIAVLMGLLLSSGCQHASRDTVSAADSVGNSTVMDFQQDTLSEPHRIQLLFGDSLNRAFFWDSESRLTEAADGSVSVDGLAVLYIEKASVPFALRTSLMDIEISELPLLLQIDAFDREAGQSLELFSGRLRVQKNYESAFPSLDTLDAGDLYMINKDIDLSEKEHLDDFTVLHWWESYIKSRH